MTSIRPANDNGEVPEAQATLADDCEQLPAEMAPLPPVMSQVAPNQKSPAQWTHERVILYIKNFEEQLDENHEVGMGFVSGGAGVMRIQGVGFFAPDMVAFYGIDENGNKANLVQHYSQLNLMLKAMPKMNDIPSRIGFQLQNQLEQNTIIES